MRKKITNELKEEILIILKKEEIEVSHKSELCKVFNVCIQTYELFKIDKKVEINRKIKIELLQILKQGYINNVDSELKKLITPPTFLDIMKLASQVSRR
jgi:hypothetical protein